MKYIQKFENVIHANKNESKRQKIFLGGYEMWLDKDNSIIYDKEQSKYGTPFDVAYDGKVIFALNLTKDEKRELLNYINN